jgi:hypothetical protein
VTPIDIPHDIEVRNMSYNFGTDPEIMRFFISRTARQLSHAAKMGKPYVDIVVPESIFSLSWYDRSRVCEQLLIRMRSQNLRVTDCGAGMLRCHLR